MISGLVDGDVASGSSGVSSGVVGAAKTLESLNDKSLDLYSLIGGNNPDLYHMEFPPFPNDLEAPSNVSMNASNSQSLQILAQKPSSEKLLQNAPADTEVSQEDLVVGFYS